MADFHEDGNADLVCPHTSLQRYEIACFDTPTAFNPQGSANPYRVVADLFTHDDSHADLAVALDLRGVQIVLAVDTSTGLGLGPGLTISRGTKPRSVLAADLDNDGDADVATHNSGFYCSESVLARDPPPAAWGSRCLNCGTGTFAADRPTSRSPPLRVHG